MAIRKINERRSASAQFITGLDGEGKETYITRTLANFKPDAALEDVFNVVVQIGSLFPYDIKTANLIDRCEITE
ncbi:MAG: DUF1659 domain-containing protein [Clostridiaceae bacterium]|nr:DUF1659 domain-containing protein [Clostridiaceae bacterium]